MPALDVTKLKVADLKSELQARGLPVSGLKAALAERLQAALDAEDNSAVTEAPGEDTAVKESGKEVSGDIQDATEAPGDTVLTEPAQEAAAPTDAETTVALEAKPVEPAAPAAPSEVVEPSRAKEEPAGGLVFSSKKDEPEGEVATIKRKREDEPAEEREEKVEPPAVQAEEAMQPNDAVPPPPADVAARLEIETEPDRKRAKLSPADIPPKPATISIKGAAAAEPSPVPDAKPAAASSAAASSSSKSGSPSFFISNLTRPCPDAELERMLSEYGEIIDIYINKIKTHAIVTLDRPGAAEAAIEALQGKVWPDGGRQLTFRALPSAQSASELIAFDKRLGGRERFVLHIDPGTGNASLRTQMGAQGGQPTAPRGLASSLPAALATAVSPASDRPPAAPVGARADAAAAFTAPPPASYSLHRPGPRGEERARFNLTNARPPIYWRERTDRA